MAGLAYVIISRHVHNMLVRLLATEAFFFAHLRKHAAGVAQRQIGHVQMTGGRMCAGPIMGVDGCQKRWDCQQRGTNESESAEHGGAFSNQTWKSMTHTGDRMKLLRIACGHGTPNVMTDTPASDTPTLEIAVMPVTAFQQNCSLLTCTQTKKAALVDPGGEAEKLIAAIEQADVALEQVLLTHGHIDHVGGAADVAAHFGVPIVGPHRADEPIIAGIAMQAQMFGVPDVKVPTIDRWLDHGESVSVGELTFDVLFTPGHAPGHVIFVNHAHTFIVMGDVLFQGSVGRTDLPGSDHGALMKSIFQTVLPLGDDYQFLPGHGPGSSLGAERQSNPYILQGWDG